jgi:hypothetical protein
MAPGAVTTVANGNVSYTASQGIAVSEIKTATSGSGGNVQFSSETGGVVVPIAETFVNNVGVAREDLPDLILYDHRIMGGLQIDALTRGQTTANSWVDVLYEDVMGGWLWEAWASAPLVEDGAETE